MSRDLSEEAFPGGQSAGTESLDTLIVSLAQGDTDAFDPLFRQLSQPMYRLVLSVVRDSAQAEEVTQDVLIEIWRTAGRFDPAKGKALAWATTIARRRAIDRVRSAAADAARDRRGGHVQAGWDQVSEAVQENLERERLSYSLENLSGPQRQVIMLAYYGGHTCAEVAAILDIAVGTVKGRIRSGLARLRENMYAS